MVADFDLETDFGIETNFGIETDLGMETNLTAVTVSADSVDSFKNGKL